MTAVVPALPLRRHPAISVRFPLLPMDRFEDAKLRVKEATDLVALIESYLPLKPRGRQLLALCPFHPEKSPSFTVWPDSQHYYCFGCGKSGDVFTFLMEREGLSFREAMETLADRVHVPLDGVFRRGGGNERRGPDPYSVLGEVAAFLHGQLLGDAAGSEPARAYLERRSLLTAATAWQLGFHPGEGALRTMAQQRRWPTAILEEAGLLRGTREPFAGRVMFPIEDERGRVCGFGGRVLPGAPPRSDGTEQPKYINSPEAWFFNKRQVLYGLHKSKLAGSRRIVVMEGYTDVIACHLAGFQGAVAALGTAFTADHSRKVERYATDGVVLLFDGDRAGLQAAERAMRELVNSRVSVRVALMTGAKDPADYVVALPDEEPDLVIERRARFADLIDGADEALVTWFRLLRRRLDFAQAAQLEAAARECGMLLQAVDSDLRRQALLQEMARHLAVPPESLARLLRKLPARPARERAADGVGPNGGPTSGGNPGRSSKGDRSGVDPASPARVPSRPLTPDAVAERDVLAAVIQQPDLIEQVAVASLQAGPVSELMALIQRAVTQGRLARAEVVRHVFAGCAERPDLGAVLAAAIARADEIPDPAAFFALLQRDRQRLVARDSARSVRQQLQDALAAGDRDTADRLTRELVEQMRQQRPRAHSGRVPNEST